MGLVLEKEGNRALARAQRVAPRSAPARFARLRCAGGNALHPHPDLEQISHVLPRCVLGV